MDVITIAFFKNQHPILIVLLDVNTNGFQENRLIIV